MRYLAVGAHPDDVEFHCAGTLLKAASQGHEIVVGIATNGDKGHFVIPPGQLADIRRKESESAASVLGASLIWLGFPDGTLVTDLEHRMAFIEMVRQARPDVVLAHDPDDYHPDHRVSYHLVRDAIFLSTVPHVTTDSPALEKMPSLYRMDTGGPGFEPTDYVDVTDVYEIKIEALKCHACQFDWIREHSGHDMTEPMMATNRFRGQSCGVQYAEAFRREGRTAAMTPSRLLP